MSALTALASTALLTMALRAQQPHPSDYSLNGVHVIERYDAYNFLMNYQGTVFALTACQDFVPTSEIKAGVNLTWLGYYEDRVHHCQELDGPHEGYALERNKQNEPVIHDWKVDAFSRSPATPCATETEARSFRP